ncbi:hypothetical protein D3C80_2142150 [compost metagenome]
MHIFHPDPSVDAFLRRSLMLQIVIKLVQGSPVHPAAVVADMEQQLVLSNLTPDT